MSLVYKAFSSSEHPVFILVPCNSNYTIGFASQFSEIGEGFAIYIYIYENEKSLWATTSFYNKPHKDDYGPISVTSDAVRFNDILDLNKDLYELLIKNIDVIHYIEQDHVVFKEKIFFIKKLDFEMYIFPHMISIETKTDLHNVQ